MRQEPWMPFCYGDYKPLGRACERCPWMDMCEHETANSGKKSCSFCGNLTNLLYGPEGDQFPICSDCESTFRGFKRWFL